MSFNELLSKRLIFVSGKGGVGKTTIATGIALVAAKQKKQVLIVEMNASGRVAPLFGMEPTPDRETALAPHIAAINLNPKNCFEEYVLLQVRFKKIYDLFFNNRFVTNFLEAVPGLNEILMLGKIYEFERMVRAKTSPEKLYDLIVVDMPATGHGLSALEVPNVLESLVKMGPLHANAVRINALLADAARTVICLVTLAEEMPVTETVEFAAALKSKIKIAFGPLFVNAVVTAPPKIKLPKHGDFADELAVYRDYYELAQSRAALNAEYVAQIAQRLPDLERIALPFRRKGVDDVRGIGELLESYMEAR